jgi:hypothetical protein
MTAVSRLPGIAVLQLMSAAGRCRRSNEALHLTSALRYAACGRIVEAPAAELGR